MSIPLSSNFNLSAQLPLDSRMVVTDATARDSIPSVQRFDGLFVYLVSTNETWQLQGGITNGDWVLFGSGGGLTQVYHDNTLTGDGSSGDPLSVVGANDDSVLAAAAATTAVLPNSPTYSNGTGGVGATLTSTGNHALGTIDGVTLIVGSRVLVKNQATQLQNGLYEVTTLGSGAAQWVLTRTTDSDSTSELTDQEVLIAAGTTNINTLFEQTTDSPTIGTNNIVYATSTGRFVTQKPAGTQTNHNIAVWTNKAKQLYKGSTDFTWDDTTKTFQVLDGSSNQILIIDPSNVLFGIGDIAGIGNSGRFLNAKVGTAEFTVAQLSTNEGLSVSIDPGSSVSGFSIISNNSNADEIGIKTIVFDGTATTTNIGIGIYADYTNPSNQTRLDIYDSIQEFRFSSLNISIGGVPYIFPSTLGSAGDVLTDAAGDGTLSWSPVGGGSGSPGGSDTNVQYNDSGSFGGDNNFTWDKTNKIFQVGDIGNSSNMTTLSVDDSTQTILAKAGPGSSSSGQIQIGSSYSRLQVFDSGGVSTLFQVISSGTAELNATNSFDVQTPSFLVGDYGLVGNGTIFAVGDLLEQYIFNKPNFDIANISYVFPSSQGAPGSVLTNDGSGNLSWV